MEEERDNQKQIKRERGGDSRVGRELIEIEGRKKERRQ